MLCNSFWYSKWPFIVVKKLTLFSMWEDGKCFIWLQKKNAGFCKYIFTKNNQTRDVSLLSVFKIHRGDFVEGAGGIFRVDLPVFPKYFPHFHKPHSMHFGQPAQNFFSEQKYLIIWRWLQQVNWKLPRRRLNCWQPSSKIQTFLSYNVLIFINY